MKFIQLATLAGTALALPSHLSDRQTCTSPKLRKSWAKGTAAEKTSYLNAAVCVVKKKSRLNPTTNATLHDDFALVHATVYQQVHDVPAFLPWHRYYLTIYESALRDCGYTGTLFYWDWITDSADPTKSSVWDPVLGFGGNGVLVPDNNGWPRRVLDGPFKDYSPLYWNTEVWPHGLSRDWLKDEATGKVTINGAGYAQAVMDEANAKMTYDEFRRTFEQGAHAAVHVGVGGGMRGLGDMGLQSASPNDPLFFLHHTQVDRLWWLWQQKNPQARTFAYDGFIPNQDGTNGRAVTLNDALPGGGLAAANGVVRDYMDVKGGKLCYTY